MGIVEGATLVSDGVSAFCCELPGGGVSANVDAEDEEVTAEPSWDSKWVGLAGCDVDAIGIVGVEGWETGTDWL